MSTPPLLAHSREELRNLLSSHPGRVGFVPTMGALHAGHASLMAEARRQVGDGPVVVSIFVNPTQFAPGEDFERYPRTLEADLLVCAEQGVDIVFVPGVDEVYPRGHGTASGDHVTVDPGALATILEGRSRPTHFRGVLTVVAKLFGLVRPDVAVFGQKDYQQLALIKRMVDDLCMGVEIVGAQTVREPDGLAMSSRNRYLNPEQRRQAVALSQALRAAQDAGPGGLEDAMEAAHAVLRQAHGVDLDYLEVRHVDLDPLPSIPLSTESTEATQTTQTTEARILIAARVGTTRLIDNLPITLGVRTLTNPGAN